MIGKEKEVARLRGHHSTIRVVSGDPSEGVYLLLPAVFLDAPLRRKRERIRRCSRICSGQSTSEPQGSTGAVMLAVSLSLKSIYSLQISIGLNKSFDLLWEQRVVCSNHTAPTNLTY
jgi:hypothetical protein